MPLGTILVPAFDQKGLEEAVAAALPFAKATKAEITGLHIRARHPSAQVAEYYWATSVMKEFEENVRRRADAMRKTFEEAVGGPCDWLQPEGSEEVDYGVAARAADLIVAPSPESCDRPDAADLLETLLITSGRPVLISPPKEAPRVPSSYLIGWNGSLEAARAISVARPLLELAGRATVLSIGQLPGRAPDAAAVAATLSRGGIKAKGVALPKTDGSVVKALTREAEERGAEALLLGAYSHSRLRERILGGVTRKSVLNAGMATVLVH
ncbi:MAG: universal stress protein [Parvularcula sp.]|jgi:nucleotide-binding universal stress UspA family protein|nr:universal stress protein [Parvularcula sp.]